jgi:hypothetical protein
MLDQLGSQPAQLRPEFESLSSSDLLNHFRERGTPSFLPGFEVACSTAALQRDLFPDETKRLIESASVITKHHRWPLLGFGEKDFGHLIEWQRDPLSGRTWPLDYHADIPLWHNDGSDIRVLWELNRLGHLITLGRGYALTNDEEFATEFFMQLESWRQQNPVGRGANWSCAMEVALRAMNLLAAFSLFRRSPSLSEERVVMLLTMLDQHGAHIRRNLEFSHVATSNHYLSDIVGLLWIAIMMPELARAKEWREFALAEILCEMEKQILADGADYEASTGYHSFVLELFLHSFLLCRANEIQIEDRYWRKLHAMLVYLRAILRPDGFAPLIGDTDGGQVLPIVPRDANDRVYLLALGAVAFKDSQFKSASYEAPQELLWVLGEEGLRTYEELANSNEKTLSQAFPDAGTYVLRQDDLFLLFNANEAMKGRPASHRHNDALSIEVSACGSAFIVDPGSFVYTANLRERHLFRSTAYHSTVEVDGAEQNSIDQNLPFTVGSEAQARVLEWQTGPYFESLAAEHYGYRRLPQPVIHKRKVVFNKQKRYWFVSDELIGEGQHDVSFRFHLAPGLESEVRPDGILMMHDKVNGARLLIRADELNGFLPRPPELELQFSSQNYGEKSPSISVCWLVRTALPFEMHFVIVPVPPGEDDNERLSLALSFED